MIETITFTKAAWLGYLYWQARDKKILDRIDTLINEVANNPLYGIGKPEALKANLSGFWSRRISETHRLVYAIDENTLTIISCRYHYDS